MKAAPVTPSGKTWRRLLTAVVALAVPLVGLTAPAQAASTGTASVVSTNGNAGSHASSNTTSATVVISTSESFYYGTSATAPPTITFTRHGSETGSGSSDSIPFSISSATGSIPGTANTFTGTVDFNLANPGDYNITVTGNGPSSASTLTDTCSSCFSVLSPGPVLVSTDTPTLAQGGSATVTFSGSRFARGNYSGTNSNYACAACNGAPKIVFRLSGSSTDSTDFTFSDPKGGAVAATASTITKVVTVKSTATVGSYDIYIVNTDGQTGVLKDGLTVEKGLTVNSVSPTTRGQNSTGGEIVVTGDNFPSDISGTITIPSGSVGNNGVTYDFVRDSATQVRFTNVAVSATATTGARTITLSSASRHAKVTDSTKFSITAAPTASSLSAPDSTVSDTYGQGATNVRLTMAGSGFVSGAQLSFSPATGITVNSTTVATDGSSVTADISIDSAAPTGSVAVSVVNGDGGQPTLPCSSSCSLTINGAPTITSVSPNHGARGNSVDVTIQGTNLADATNKAKPTIVVGDGSVVTVSNVVTVSATKVTATFTIGAGGTGSYDISIKNNDDKGQSVCAGCFSVDTLSVTGSDKSSSLNNTTQTIQVTGSGFAPDATVQMVKTGTGSTTVPPIDGVVTIAPTESSPGAADGTSLTADFNLNGVDPGTYEFRVTNPTGTHKGSGQGVVFTVVAVNPVISTVTPNSRGGGAVNQTVVISGDTFGPSADVAFSNPAVHIDSKSVDNSTQITLKIHVDKISSADNSGTVTVTNTDGKSAQSAFTLVVGPTITGGAKVTQAQGAPDVSFQLTGQQGTFPATANAQLTASGGSGVTFTNVTVTPGNPGPLPAASDDQLDATLHAIQSATVGTYDVVLVDSSTGGRDVCSGCVEVTPGPVVSSVTPSSGQPGHDVTVAIAGDHFQSDAQVAVTQGITVSNVQVAPNSIKATFSIPGGATPGATADVTVTNPSDGGSSTLPSAFTIIDVPGAPTNVTATAGDKTADVSWTAPSANGGTISEYTVTAQATSGPDVTQNVTGSPAATSIHMTGLTDGVEYTFVVVASNEVGTGPASAPSNAVTPVGAPDQVTGVTATPGDTTADVVWNAPSDNGAQITKYTVTAVSPTTPTGDVTKTVTGTPAATSVTIDGLQNGTTYRIKVFATNSVGDGPASALSSPVTPAIASTLTIAKSTGRIRYGRTATLSGTLTETSSGNPLAGENVDLYGATAPSGTFQKLGTFVTDSSGNWSASIAPRRTTTYYATFAGAGANGAADSAQAQVKVAYGIVWRAPKPGGSVTHGRVAFKLRVRPFVTGAHAVLLERRANGSVVRLSRAQVGSRGFLTFHHRMGKGTYRIAVRVFGKDGCVTTGTRFIRIHVV